MKINYEMREDESGKEWHVIEVEFGQFKIGSRHDNFNEAMNRLKANIEEQYEVFHRGVKKLNRLNYLQSEDKADESNAYQSSFPRSAAHKKEI